MKKTVFFAKSLAIALLLSMLTLVAGNGLAETLSTFDASPARITFNGNGELLVTDYALGQVLTVAPDTLDIVSEININGRPLAVAWANDFIYVGNRTTGQVEVYNNNGHEQFVLGYGDYPISKPQDIAVGNGNVYVVDGFENIVKVFNQDGSFIKTIPEIGYDEKILTNPTAIAVDEVNQQIYVSDYGDLGSTSAIAPRIQIFNLDGKLLNTINSGSPNKYRFTMPQGLTVNGTNKLFMIDSLTGEIHIFDVNKGSLFGKVKGSGIDAGINAIKMPLDLVIDNTTQDMFVTNNMMASIKVFEGAGGL